MSENLVELVQISDKSGGKQKAPSGYINVHLALQDGCHGGAYFWGSR